MNLRVRPSSDIRVEEGMKRAWIFALMTITLASRAQQATVAEQYLVSAIDEERAAHSVAALHLDLALTRAAALHAEQMASHGAISHRFPEEPKLAERASSVGAHFQRIAENVAEGPSVPGLHDALMRSPGHRANILNRAVDAVGVAIVLRRGQFYAVEEFAHSVPLLTLVQQETTVAMSLDQAGLEILSNKEARRTCVLANGYTGEEQPAFVMRYTTGDLSELPAALRERISHGRERRAAVGACTPSASAFTRYSIAVLLFP